MKYWGRLLLTLGGGSALLILVIWALRTFLLAPASPLPWFFWLGVWVVGGVVAALGYCASGVVRRPKS